MTCPACGFENDSGVYYCRQCRHLFFGDYDSEAHPEQGERILELAEACEWIRNGMCTVAEFREWLREFQAKQEAKEKAIQDIEIPFGLEDEFQEEREVGFNGVEACSRAVEQLMEYDPELSGEHIILDSLQTFYQGISRVKEAMRINRASYGRPLWL